MRYILSSCNLYAPFDTLQHCETRIYPYNLLHKYLAGMYDSRTHFMLK